MPLALSYSGAGAGGNFSANPVVVGLSFRSDPIVTGGVGPYTFALTAGALPGGLTLDPTGTIYGTLTTAGSFSYTIQVTDSTLATATATVPVTVSALQVWNMTFPPGVKNVAITPLQLTIDYATTLFAAGGAPPVLVPPYSFSNLLWAGTDPGGMSLSSSGLFTGTPIHVNTPPGFTQEFNASIEVDDSRPQQISANNPWHVFLTSFTPSGGSPTCSLMAAPGSVCLGSSSTLSWTTTNTPTSASIDHGVGSVSPVSGSVSVSPTVTTTYTLTVTNASGSSQCQVTVVVNPPTCTLAAVLAGGMVTLTWTVSCGVAASASLNQGIGAVNPAGGSLVIPAPSSTTTYVLTVTNSAGSSTCQATVTITPPVCLPVACNLEPPLQTREQQCELLGS